MFYVTQLYQGQWYLCATTQEEHAGLRVPPALNRVYETKADADAAHRLAQSYKYPAISDAPR